MKVENKGVVITDFPGPLEKLIVQKVSGQVIVTYVNQSFSEVDMPLKQFEEFVEAIQEALKQAREMAGPVVNLTGPWDHLKYVPADITKVWDKDGDSIMRKACGEWEGSPDYWSERYGPFRAER